MELSRSESMQTYHQSLESARRQRDQQGSEGTYGDDLQPSYDGDGEDSQRNDPW
jgi:hypothetical protein